MLHRQLPTQTFVNWERSCINASDDPARDIMVAIFQQAINDLVLIQELPLRFSDLTDVSATDYYHMRDACWAFQDARDWLYMDVSPFLEEGFLYMCEVLGLHPGRVREALKERVEVGAKIYKDYLQWLVNHDNYQGRIITYGTIQRQRPNQYSA